MTTLSVVVVTFRRAALLAECLRSVVRAVAHAGVETQVVVVDNGSQDETSEVAREVVPDGDVIVIGDNIGFTPALVRGLDASRGEWIALMNDDVTADDAAIAELLAVGRLEDDVGAVGAQMRFADRPDLINSAGMEIDRLGIAADRLVGEPVEASESEPVEVFGVSGGAALYRRAMLDDIGGFDTTFFGYMEDADVAWRARMRGWRAFYAPRAVVYHHHSATLKHGSDLKYFLVGRNRVRLLAKNAETRHLLRYSLRMLAYDAAYVGFVAARSRTLAPLRGRLVGLREWRRYRSAGAATRRPVDLAPVHGFSRALRRHTVWTRRAPGAG